MCTLVLGEHVCNKVISIDTIQQDRLAQSVEHQTTNFKVVGSSPTVGKNVLFYSPYVHFRCVAGIYGGCG